MLALTSENFEKETKSGAVVIDFWASWCGPCRALGPIFEELSKDMKGVKFGKINVDEQPGLSEKFEVSSIPTLIILKDGKPVANRVGSASRETLREWIDSAAK